MSEEDTLIMPQTATHIASGLTGKGTAAALLLRVRDGWADLSPSQQAECSAILGRLAIALKREHSVATRQPLPLLGRIAS